MKTIAVIQARMGSSRLPGKVLMRLGGVPAIAHTIRRAKRIAEVDEVILATGENDENRILVDVAKAEGAQAAIGSVDNVLERFYFAAAKYKPDAVVRLTGDCPMIDPVISSLVIQEHEKSGNDYTSNTRTRSYPRGLDTEVLKFDALEKAFRSAKDPFELEHVTPYLFRHPELFKIGQVVSPAEQSKPGLRMTIDTPEDFEFAEAIFNALYERNPFFGVNEVLQFLKKHPEVEQINADVVQKAT